jgi:hypothetical protein
MASFSRTADAARRRLKTTSRDVLLSSGCAEDCTPIRTLIQNENQKHSDTKMRLKQEAMMIRRQQKQKQTGGHQLHLLCFAVPRSRVLLYRGRPTLRFGDLKRSKRRQRRDASRCSHGKRVLGRLHTISIPYNWHDNCGTKNKAYRHKPSPATTHSANITSKTRCKCINPAWSSLTKHSNRSTKGRFQIQRPTAIASERKCLRAFAHGNALRCRVSTRMQSQAA